MDAMTKMSHYRFTRQLNWNDPIEDWTPGHAGDRLVGWVSAAIALLLLVFL